MAEEVASFDEDTHTFVQQVYEAWSNIAPISTYARIRDEILVQQEQTETRAATLSSVAKLAYPEELYNDAQWDDLFTRVGRIDYSNGRDAKKRKKQHNKNNKLRNLAIIATLWSPGIVFYYGWNTAAQGQMNMMRACAVRYPRCLEEFCPRLNHVLLERHCQAIKNGKLKTLIEAPIQPLRDFDLVALGYAALDSSIEDQWVTNIDGRLPVDDKDTLLCDLRPNHFQMYLLERDRYGILVVRGDVDPRPLRAAVLRPLSEVYLPLLQTRGTSFADFATPGELYSPTDVPYALDLGSADEPMFDLPFEPPPLPISESSPDVVSVASPENLSLTDSSADASVTASSSATPPSNMTAEFDWNGESHFYDQHGGHPAYEANFDKFGTATPVHFPAVLSPVRQEASLSSLPASSLPALSLPASPSSVPSSPVSSPPEEVSPQIMATTNNSADGSSRRTVGLLRPFFSVALPQSPITSDLTLASPFVQTDHSLTLEEALHNRYHEMITTYAGNM